MGKKPVVNLRVYRGIRMSYDENGNVQNENHLIKLQHDTKEFENFKKNIRANGYLKVVVESAVEVTRIQTEDKFFVDETTPCEKSVIKDIQAEIDHAYKNEVKKELSEEQKRIAILEAKLEELTKLSITPKDDAPVDKDVLNDLREEYKELNNGKKPYAAWSEAELRERIIELKSKA